MEPFRRYREFWKLSIEESMNQPHQPGVVVTFPAAAFMARNMSNISGTSGGWHCTHIGCMGAEIPIQSVGVFGLSSTGRNCETEEVNSEKLIGGGI